MDIARRRQSIITSLINSMQNKPARLIALSFFFVIFVGTTLLMLPVSSRSGQPTSLLVSLFTATSATCVTGLVVVDTGTYWSTFGHSVIISLIQVGGLSVVTLTTFFFILLKRKMGIRTMALAQESAASFTMQDVKYLVTRIISVTFSFELVGALIFAARYVPKFGWPRGLYMSVFQAVSAFCNAGFDLMGPYSGKFTSLTAWNGDPVVLLTTALLIISGGLGFIVWADILNLNKDKGLNFYSKLVIRMTGFLIVAGSVFFLVAEFSNMDAGAMGNLPLWQKIQAAFFQSVTTRTAGFNSLEQATLTESSKIFSTILMYIGASSGSTGGGIKVTTFSVILFFIISEIRGYDDTLMFRRRINPRVVSKSLVIATMSIALLMIDTMIMSLFERDYLNHITISALDLLFEATSAFGTVGLSSAGTPSLHPGSHIVLIITMYIGRIGPVAFAMALSQRSPLSKDKIYPEAKIHVG
ncbi:MAG: TrkH family potassium uptake protein [Saccharofermentanales bacterium]